MELVGDKINKKEKEEKGEGAEEKNGEEFVKVSISKRAEKAVKELVARVNENFDGGRVNRQDLISWVLMRFSEECTEQEIRAIRVDHFDEIALLELCLKRSKLAGSLPLDLRKLLIAQAGLEDLSKKSNRKTIDSKVHQ
jgi:hypothetical protein